MAGISLSNYSKAKFSADSVNSEYAFTDVDMDMHQEMKNIVSKEMGNNYNTIEGKDLAVIHDTAAIANSIFYILATSRGQRPLLPTFGCDLRRYIAEPMTQVVANQIEDDISESLRIWEPRIKVTQIKVTPNEDEHEYFVEISAYVPFFRNEEITVFGKITTNDNFVRVLR
jgi:phage baseplate assembly protein W